MKNLTYITNYKFNELKKYESERFEIISFDYSMLDEDEQELLKKRKHESRNKRVRTKGFVE